MENYQFCLLAGCLLAACIWDLRTKTIPYPVILSLLLCGICVRIVEKDLLRWEILTALIPGAALMVYSHISKEALGEGDAWIVLGMGLWMTMEKLLGICLLAFVAAGLVGLFLFLIFCRSGIREMELPFMPFLMGSTLLFRLLGGC